MTCRHNAITRYKSCSYVLLSAALSMLVSFSMLFRTLNRMEQLLELDLYQVHYIIITEPKNNLAE